MKNLKKYFFEDGAPGVATLDNYKELIKDGTLKEVEIYEMEKDIGGSMYCTWGERLIEKGDCGKKCKNYSPCNKINGKCRFLENGYKQTGRKFMLTKDGLKELINSEG